MYLWTDRLRKTWLDKCLKSPVSEDPSTSNIVNRLKHSSKLNDSTFTIFIDTCAGNSGLKTLSEWYGKSDDCLLIRWVPIISILFLSETTYSNIFRSNYLRNKKEYVFFFPFSKFRFNFEYFWKKDDPHIGDIFLNLWTPKNGIR